MKEQGTEGFRRGMGGFFLQAQGYLYWILQTAGDKIGKHRINSDTKEKEDNSC